MVVFHLRCYVEILLFILGFQGATDEEPRNPRGQTGFARPISREALEMYGTEIYCRGREGARERESERGRERVWREPYTLNPKP